MLELADAAGAVDRAAPIAAARGSRRASRTSGVTPGRYTPSCARRRSRRPAKKPKKPKKGAKAPPPDAAAPAGPAPVYELTAQLGPAGEHAEREPDDDRGTANDLIVGDNASPASSAGPATPTCGSSRSRRCRRRTRSTSRSSAVEGVALESRSPTASASRSSTRKAPRGAPLVVRGLVPGRAAGRAAVPLPDDPRRSLEPRDRVPAARVSAKVAGPRRRARAERHARQAAMAMPADRTVVHATWTPGDIDCFALAARRRGAHDRGHDRYARARSISPPSCSSTARSSRRREQGRQGRRREGVRRPCPRAPQAVIRDAAATDDARGEGAVRRPDRRKGRAPRAMTGPRRHRAIARREPQILVVLALTNLVAYAARNALFARLSRSARRATASTTPRSGCCRPCSCARTRSRRCRSAGPAIATIAAA